MELMIPLSSQDPRPLYEQIYQYIKGEIRNGGLKPMKKMCIRDRLASLEVEGYSLTPTFNKDTESYDVIVNPSVGQISVKAGTIDSKASVSGTGTISLQSGNNTISIEVKAENGSVRTYKMCIRDNFNTVMWPQGP